MKDSPLHLFPRKLQQLIELGAEARAIRLDQLRREELARSLSPREMVEKVWLTQLKSLEKRTGPRPPGGE